MQQEHFHISTIKITRMVDSRADEMKEKKDYFVASNLTVLNKVKDFRNNYFIQNNHITMQ